jgi:phosphoenolpyruvate---glycerone phosphotransferase subunit DhaL
MAGELTTMTFDEAARRRLIEGVAHRVIAHADELTALDQAIGDGDHGINMKRGFEAVLADLDNHAAKPLPEGLKAVGMALVMKVGGASGPLYGTLFMTLGNELPPEPSADDLVRAFGIAIDAVKARGKSDAGQKTMIDVLVPVRDALAAGKEPVAAADRAAEATIPMQALRGRASFLGARSIGHMDPGACSSALIVAAVAEVLEERG